MQWSLSGTVNWTAPRRIALAFTPVLGAVTLIGLAFAIAMSGPQKDGPDLPGYAIVGLCGAIIVAIHALHLWMIGRSLGQRPDHRAE